jgi:AcrR family transcriptional regulator
MSTTRDYHSETRDRAKAETRESIIRAVVKVILNDGVHAFTMQNVAARAAVSLRTVYRHFESRELLLEGLSEYLDEAMSDAGFSAPTGVEELIAIAPSLYRRFDAIRDALSASVVASIATGYRSHSHVKRWAAVGETLAAAYPNLRPEELGEASVMIGTLTGSRTWYVLTIEVGLDAEQGGRAVAWGLRTLLDDLNARNKAAAHIKARRGSHGTATHDA